mgnify:CR=1 FL=1
MTRALSLLVSVSLIAASAAAQTATEDDRSKPAPRGTAPAPAALTALRDSLTNGLALARSQDPHEALLHEVVDVGQRRIAREQISAKRRLVRL